LIGQRPEDVDGDVVIDDAVVVNLLVGQELIHGVAPQVATGEGGGEIRSALPLKV
jgi:hypothetical protein